MTTTYSITRDQIIQGALRKLQVLELGVAPDVNTVINASQSLNIMIKAWQSQGIKLWTVQEYILSLVASKTTYVIGSSGPDLVADKPLKVIQAWIRNISVSPQIDTPMQILSKQEYNMLGSKSATGTPNSIFYDPRVTSGSMSLYLTPDTIAATTFQLHFVGQRPINDVLVSSDVPDFPNEWMQALVWGLADELSLEYGCLVNQRQEISSKAEKYKNELMDWDVEASSTMFTPDSRMR